MFGVTEAIGAVSNLIGDIIKRKFPDATEIEKAKMSQLAAEIQNQYQIQLAQLDINKTEAENPNIFVSGCRPAAMWVCVSGLAYTVGYPLLVWGSSLLTITPPPPLDTAYLSYLLGALLGLGGMRSFDKSKGVDTKGVSL